MDNNEQRDPAEERANADELRTEDGPVQPSELERRILDRVGSNHLRSMPVAHVRQDAGAGDNFPAALMSTIERGWISAAGGELTITPVGRVVAEHDLYRHRRAGSLAGALSRVLAQAGDLTLAERNENYPARVDILARLITYLGEAALISGRINSADTHRVGCSVNISGASPEALAPLVLLEDIATLLSVRARGGNA